MVDIFSARQVADFVEADAHRRQQQRELAMQGIDKHHRPQGHTPVTFTRDEVARLYAAHRRGEIAGPEWAALEIALFRAGREGRILGGIADIGDRGERGPPDRALARGR